MKPEISDDYDHWILARLAEFTESIESCFKNFDLTKEPLYNINDIEKIILLIVI